MSTPGFLTQAKQNFSVGISLVALIANLSAPFAANAADEHVKHADDFNTRTPIKHVIVIIGENRSFDHVFATYKPFKGETVRNLLSEGIVNEDGTPGPNFWMASQSRAYDSHTDGYRLSPPDNVTYEVLPPVLAGGYTTPPFSTAKAAQAVENGLEPQDYVLLTTGGTGLKHGAVDTRIPNATSLPPGPFQITSKTHPYDAYDNSPVHRFYQMWQQVDCSPVNITKSNPTGCQHDLFPWVETTVGAGTNGEPKPAGFNDMSTGEGSTSMGFYNMLEGDAPYLKYLADHYAMSDNYHQPIMGGTLARSGSPMPTVIPPGRRTTSSFPPARIPVSWTRLRIPTRLPEPTTGTWKTVTATARSGLRLRAAEATPIALIPSSPGLRRSQLTSARSTARSIRTANRANTMS